MRWRRCWANVPKSGLVREGREKAEVSAEFQVAEGSPHWQVIWPDNDLAGESGRMLLRSVIEATGRSRAYVNGRAASAQQLQDIGEYLVDIHGQHAHQSLLRAASQRELFDGYAGAAELAGQVAQLIAPGRNCTGNALRIESNAQSIADGARATRMAVEGTRSVVVSRRRLGRAAGRAQATGACRQLDRGGAIWLGYPFRSRCLGVERRQCSAFAPGGDVRDSIRGSRRYLEVLDPAQHPVAGGGVRIAPLSGAAGSGSSAASRG